MLLASPTCLEPNPAPNPTPNQAVTGTCPDHIYECSEFTDAPFTTEHYPLKFCCSAEGLQLHITNMGRACVRGAARAGHHCSYAGRHLRGHALARDAQCRGEIISWSSSKYLGLGIGISQARPMSLQSIPINPLPTPTRDVGLQHPVLMKFSTNINPDFLGVRARARARVSFRVSANTGRGPKQPSF